MEYLYQNDMMGSSSARPEDMSYSKINNHKKKAYELLVSDPEKLNGPNGTVRCPFCEGNRKYEYRHLNHLRTHAISMAKGSSKTSSAEQQANHLALTAYLEAGDIADRLPEPILQSIVLSPAENSDNNGKMEELQDRINEKMKSLRRIIDEKDELHQAFCEEKRKLLKFVDGRTKQLNEREELLKNEQKKLDEPNELVKQERQRVKEREKLVDHEKHKLEEDKKKREEEDAIKTRTEQEAVKNTMRPVRRNIKKETETEDEDEDEDMSDEQDEEECQCNNQLQEARKLLILGMNEMRSSSSTTANIGIKRMGEIDEKLFRNACKRRRFPTCQTEIRALEACSFWQGKITNPDADWNPFEVTVDSYGHAKVEVRDDDEVLLSLRHEWGYEVYFAVRRALKEMKEHNPNGRYIYPELWNFVEDRKATFKEIIYHILTQLKALKRKKI